MAYMDKRLPRVPRVPNPGGPRAQQILTGDFETYFEKGEYSLKHKDMTTTNYVRDPVRFKIQSFATQLYPSGHKEVLYGQEEVQDFVRGVDWAHTAFLGHHTQFDGLILAHHLGVEPCYFLDTLSMARPILGRDIKNNLDAIAGRFRLGNKLPDVLDQTCGIWELPDQLLEKLGEYNQRDVELTEEIFWLLLCAFPQEELDLIDQTIRAYVLPHLVVDKTLAQKCWEEEVAAQEKQIDDVSELVLKLFKQRSKKELAAPRREFVKTKIRSRVSFPKLLEHEGIVCPLKVSTTTQKETYAFAKTDEGMQDLQVHDNPNVRLLAETKLMLSGTIDETRPRRILEHADPRLPIYLKYWGAHTGRWSGGDKMNPQNLPRDGDLRRCLRAPKGYKLVVVDSAQIEARVNAWLADETELLGAFRDPKRDPYCEMAEIIYGRKVYKKGSPLFLPHMKIERFVGKVTELGSGYQMGHKRYRFTLVSGSMGEKVMVTVQEAIDGIKLYRSSRPNIVRQWGAFQDIGLPTLAGLADADTTWDYKCVTLGHDKRNRCGYVILPNGMQLTYPGIKTDQSREDNKTSGLSYYYLNKRAYTSLYGGKLDENIVQALARIIVAYQALPVILKYGYVVVLMVHDEVVLLVPDAQAQDACDQLVDAMGTPFDWCPDLPVAAEGEVSDFYVKP